MDDEQVLALLSDLGDRSLEALEDLARKQELRDVDFSSEELQAGLRRLLVFGWDANRGKRATELFNRIVVALLGFPEFQEFEHCILDKQVAVTALERLEGFWNEEEDLLIQDVVYRTYKGNVKARGRVRSYVGGMLTRCSELNQNWQVVGSVLRILLPIIQGFQTPLSGADKALLSDVVLPLNFVQGKISPSEATLMLFHRPLVLCLCEFICKDTEFSFRAILNGLMRNWPRATEGNSPKEVLFLHALETILAMEETSDAVLENASMVIFKLSECFSSDNSVVCERALAFWKNEEVVKRLFDDDTTKRDPTHHLEAILRPLLVHAISHWNKTVTIMAGSVLENLFKRFPKQVIQATAGILQSSNPENDIRHLIARVKPSKDENRKSNKEKMESVVAASVPEKQKDITFMNMILGHELGNGSFSQVFYALKVKAGKPRSEWEEYALKRMNCQHKAIALREAEMMDRLNHPNCTRLIAMYESAGFINLVVEFAHQGDLHSILARMGSLDQETVAFIGAEVAAGLDAVHKQNLVFGDLKPENLLIHANGHIKLGDFGATREAQKVVDGDDPIEGTLSYLAPELFRPRDGTNEIQIPEAIDWWAYGCLIYQMLTGRPPLWVEEEREIMDKLIHFSFDKFPEGFPALGQDLVEKLLNNEPNERLCSKAGMQELEQHDFFKEIGPFHEVHNLPAPKFAKGEVKMIGGPWTRRAMSVMLSPMPEQYTTGNFNLTEIQETNTERESQFAGESTQKSFLPTLDETSAAASTAQQQPPAARTNKFQPTTTMPQSLTARRPPPNNKKSGSGKYNFMGLDLTSG